MRFYVTQRFADLPELQYPAVTLFADNWNDYGYKATFRATLHLDASTSLPLGRVKIVKLGQPRGQTPLPSSFTQLTADYVSLGQKLSYYEMLASTDGETRTELLAGLRDMVVGWQPDDQRMADDGVVDALLRFDSSQRALVDARELFSAIGPQDARVMFQYELPEGAIAQFDFKQNDGLPDRVAVVIGYNGAGKTRLLANLAMLAYVDEREADHALFIAERGRYVGTRPRFGGIIAVSYSAFDDFAVPGQGTAARDAAERARLNEADHSAHNYTYCGLRKVDETGNVSNSLKSIAELTDEFHAARRQALRSDRAQSLQAATEPIYEEPSFLTIADLPSISATETDWREAFSALSTGHKIVLNIIVQLCANLERQSIVLIDEPELHLHPPLLAALLKAIGIALDRHDSFGIIATHSPVVLQEVPARSVKVLRRVHRAVAVEAPEIETFAENVGLLTKHVFNLDSRDTDFQGTLRALARDHTLEEIENLFDGRMSSQARSLVMSYQQRMG